MTSLVVASAVVIATAGFAQGSPATDNKADPNERICRIVTQIGSRLNRSRICKTRAEWTEWRRELRENTEHTQLRRIHPEND